MSRPDAALRATGVRHIYLICNNFEGIYWFTQADEQYLEKMKEESKGLPRLRLDMLRQLKSALAEGFSKNDKTGNRFKP